MPNNLATLNGKLATALRDSSYAVWQTGEVDDLVNWAVTTLYPRVSRPLDPTSTTITLVAGTYHYSLPSGVMAVSRVDRVDTGSNEAGPLGVTTWEVVGQPILGTGKLHVAPAIVEALGTLRLIGYGRFDTTTNLIPDDYVPLVLARARAEAYRRMAGDREKFTVWLSRNQTQNVTVNELLLLINEADNEAGRLDRANKVWQRPVPARHG